MHARNAGEEQRLAARVEAMSDLTPDPAEAFLDTIEKSLLDALLPFCGPDFSCLSANADRGALFVRFTAGGEVWALSGRAGAPLSVSRVN